MRSESTRVIGGSLGPLRRHFERWRRTRPGRGRIPQMLWDAAVEAAREHGVHRTAAALRLNATALKQRVQARRIGVPRAAQPEQAAPTFVELPVATAAIAPECIMEAEDGAGTKLKIHLKGGATADLVALSRALWRGAQR